MISWYQFFRYLSTTKLAMSLNFAASSELQLTNTFSTFMLRFILFTVSNFIYFLSPISVSRQSLFVLLCSTLAQFFSCIHIGFAC